MVQFEISYLLFNISQVAVDGKVQAAEAAGFVGLLDAVDGEPGQMSNDE